MSKSSVKKRLSTMDKNGLINLLMEMYDARKEAKDYLEYFVCPNESGKLNEYKRIIEKEFSPYNKNNPKFSVCKKAISDYKKLRTSPESVADLMLFLVEQATDFTCQFGDMWEQYYTSTENNFKAALEFITKNGLEAQFQQRIAKVLRDSDCCGWGFPDALWMIAGDYGMSYLFSE